MLTHEGDMFLGASHAPSQARETATNFCMMKLDVRISFMGSTTPLNSPKFLVTGMLTCCLSAVANLLVDVVNLDSISVQ